MRGGVVIKTGGTEITWSAHQEVRGTELEIGQLAETLAHRLQDSGWVVDGPTLPSGALARPWVDATRGAEQLAVGITPSAPCRPILNNQYSLVALGRVDPTTFVELERLIYEIPFTDLELEEVAKTMPLTSQIVHRQHDWVPAASYTTNTPLDGFGAIFTIHHQTDFLLLLHQALSLGVDATLCTVIDKEYQYRFSRRVDASIRETLGIPVFTYTDLKLGIYDHLKRVVKQQVDTGSKTWKPTIVLDDGGYVLPCLDKHFNAQLSLFQGIVEQTMSGIWKLRPLGQIRVPVFSVAESDLKRTVEAHGVALAGVTNVRRLLPHTNFDGQVALVAGYGRIGSALAQVLQRFNFHVVVADSDVSQVVQAHRDGFFSYESIAEALGTQQPTFIFSCAPEGSFGRDELELLARDCVLVSMTSRDYAFDKAALALLADAEPAGTIGTLYTRRESTPIQLFLLANGYPINFHFAESMPNAQADLVMSSLIIGAINLCTATPPWPAGNDARRANDELNRGTLLADFFRSGI